MRNLILMFVSSLLAVLAGLLLYYYIVARAGQEQLTNVQAQTEATRRELDHLAKEQTQIRQTLVQPQNSLTAAQDEASLLIRADFMSATGSMRTAIAEHYMNTVKLPVSNADAGLPAADQYRGKSLKSATVTADGSIELLFDANSGVDGGRIRLIGDVAHADTMGIQWRCETGDYALIKRALPTCEYKPAGNNTADTHISPAQQQAPHVSTD